MRAFVAVLPLAAAVACGSSSASNVRGANGVLVCMWQGDIVGGIEQPPASLHGTFVPRTVNRSELPSVTANPNNRYPAPDADCSALNDDRTAPQVTVPQNVTAEATGPQGATIQASASATDFRDGPLAAICAPALNSTFPVGGTAVTCSATDASGNKGTASFAVTIVDTTAPSLALPAEVAPVEATGPAGATATATVTAADLVDGAVAVSCTPALGSTFALGTTHVACTATDKAGNAASGTISITVRDTTAPTLSLPASNAVFEATSPLGAVGAATTSAVDVVDGSVAVGCVPALESTFPLGSTDVQCTTHDAAGNAASGSFTIVVRDTTPPSLALDAPASVEAPAPEGAAISFTATVSDAGDAAPSVACALESGEAVASGALLAPGDHTISCTATDASGNQAQASAAVSVTYDARPELVVESADRLLLRRKGGGLLAAHRFRLHQANSGSGYMDIQDMNGQIGGVGYGTVIRHTDTEIEFNFQSGIQSDYWRLINAVTFFVDPLVAPALPVQPLFGGKLLLKQAVTVGYTTDAAIRTINTDRLPGILDFGGVNLDQGMYGTARLYDTDGGVITLPAAGNSEFDSRSFNANGTYLQLYAQEIQGRTFNRVELTYGAVTLSLDFAPVTVPARTPLTITSVTAPCKDTLEITVDGDAAEVGEIRAVETCSGTGNCLYSNYWASKDGQYNYPQTVIQQWSGNKIRLYDPDYFARYANPRGVSAVAWVQLQNIGPWKALKSPTVILDPVLLPDRAAACTP